MTIDDLEILFTKRRTPLSKDGRVVAVDMNVKLPVTSDGAPDWAYMERYMRDIMAVEALFADELDRVYCS